MGIEFIYNLSTVKTAFEIKNAEALMKGRGYKVKIEGESFTVRIPPRCIEIVRIKHGN